MSRSSRSICIVAPRYLSSTPRVIKEADALHEAGYSVRVVLSHGDLDRIRAHDAELAAEKPWTVDAVGWSSSRPEERMAYLRGTLRHRVMQGLVKVAPPVLLHRLEAYESVQHRMYPEVADLAAREPADLYVGHYPAGLAAAARAANRHGALLGYDVEDFHVGEAPDDQARVERVSDLERRYVPRCSYVTAASAGIAEAFAGRYGLDLPTVIYNAFPLAERESLNGDTKDRDGDALSLYWYSQTVGLDRGLQDAIRAAGRLHAPVQLHVRGALSDEVRQVLTSLAATSGVADALHFHDKVPPGELLSRAAEHDVGLALEQGHTLNRRICTTNKLFRYMLAGLAIAATDVPGQRDVLGDAVSFSGLYPPGDADALAAVLETWTNRERLEAAQSASLAAARERWNWETESQKLVDTVSAVLS